MARRWASLAADIFVTKVIDVVSRYNVDTSSYAFLLDGEGNFIAHPRKAFQPDTVGFKNIGAVHASDLPASSDVIEKDDLGIKTIKGL